MKRIILVTAISLYSLIGYPRATPYQIKQEELKLQKQQLKQDRIYQRELIKIQKEQLKLQKRINKELKTGVSK